MDSSVPPNESAKARRRHKPLRPGIDPAIASIVGDRNALPHEPKRCGAKCRGERAHRTCLAWAVRGKDRCRMHGGALRSGRPAAPSSKRTKAAKIRSRYGLVAKALMFLIGRQHRKPRRVDYRPPEADRSLDHSDGQ